jgi:hypothetical protein
MSNDIVRTLVVLALGLLSFACGPRAAPNSGGRTDCEEQCDLEVMRCLETRVCLEAGGQKVPCMEECQAELGACEQACGGR